MNPAWLDGFFALLEGTGDVKRSAHFSGRSRGAAYYHRRRPTVRAKWATALRKYRLGLQRSAEAKSAQAQRQQEN